MELLFLDFLSSRNAVERIELVVVNAVAENREGRRTNGVPCALGTTK